MEIRIVIYGVLQISKNSNKNKHDSNENCYTSDIFVWYLRKQFLSFTLYTTGLTFHKNFNVFTIRFYMQLYVEKTDILEDD